MACRIADWWFFFWYFKDTVQLSFLLTYFPVRSQLLSLYLFLYLEYACIHPYGCFINGFKYFFFDELGVIFFFAVVCLFLVPGVHWDFWIYVLIHLNKIRHFLTFVVSNIFSTFPLEILIKWILYCLKLSHKSLIFFQCSFSVCYSLDSFHCYVFKFGKF